MKLKINGEIYEIDVESFGDKEVRFSFGGVVYQYDVCMLGRNEFVLNNDGVKTRGWSTAKEVNNKFDIWICAEQFQVETLKDNQTGSSNDSVLGIEAHSPMPGKISKVCVVKGQKVKKGEILLYMEAMKMEHPIKAPSDGTVAEIVDKVGQQVDQNMLLVRLSN